MVGDGDAVGIAAEILEDVLGPAEGWFGVDDPIGKPCLMSSGLKPFRSMAMPKILVAS